MPGENIILIPVLDYDRALYILSLTQGAERITRKVFYQPIEYMAENKPARSEGDLTGLFSAMYSIGW